MLELINNLDWVLRFTLWLWVIYVILRFGGSTILGLVLVALCAIAPPVGAISAGITMVLSLIFQITKWVFTIWSAFILLGYL